MIAILSRKFFSVCLFLCSFQIQASFGLYLTYPSDPSSTIAIHWFEENNANDTPLRYATLTEDRWQEALPRREEWSSGAKLYKVSLSSLLPDTEYRCILPGYSESFRFRTLPEKATREIRVVIGGDVYQKDVETCSRMNRLAADRDPDCIILGGDLAYVNQVRNPVERWEKFFRVLSDTFVTSSGRRIPVVCAVGNHEILSSSRGGGSLFLQLFPYWKGGSYGEFSIAETMLFPVLDTGHIHPIEGEQTTWLAKILDEKKEIPWKLPVYHVAAYPSSYNYGGTTPVAIRRFWCPLFEKGGVVAAFEHHNHAFKRTIPIREERPDPDGVVYFGDGAWGARLRKIRGSTWYLDRCSSERSFFLLTGSTEKISVEAFNAEGKIFDSWSAKRRATAPR